MPSQLFCLSPGRAFRLRAVLLIGLWLLPTLVAAQGRAQPQPGAQAQPGAPAQGLDCGRGPEDKFDEERWKLSEDGIVGDEQNRLVWKQCPEGLHGERCREGRLAYLSWERALEIAENSTFAGFDDWRIPKLDELRQIIQPGCFFPAVNLSLFPNTPSGWFWFDSAEADNSPRAGQLGFAFGKEFSGNQRNIVHLRLVRELPEEGEAEADAAAQEPAPDAEAPDAGAEPPAGEPGAAEAGQNAAGAAGADGQAAEPEPADAAADQPGAPVADQAGEPVADQAGDQTPEPAAAQGTAENPDQPAEQPAAGAAAQEPGLLPGPPPIAPPAEPPALPPIAPLAPAPAN
ncbi:Lcl C-terminal domain-containing protein [Thiorhodovibrio frisius]|uniref:Lcl C-terminal domain-containing protein n=1 Tax=Thiorhodovibrio frisius TaxID=631362 RepID=H8Z012_9GAMM|nr:DUF1566 domain-containing protein [Thiorhodovibrio frisius]EIC21185.1 Protein of unknown function (DUF1566) [Thiorhodovibrio frisius]WPL23761.1 Intracellular sulfur oxidation protein DsrS [Thiorhodovibrio frisius]